VSERELQLAEAIELAQQVGCLTVTGPPVGVGERASACWSCQPVALQAVKTCVVALMVVLERALRLAGVIELVLVEEWLALVRNDGARRAHCACAYFWTC